MKFILTSMTLNLITYTTIYIIVCYVNWELYNPFKWLIDLPTFSGGKRFGILCMVALYYWVILIVANGIIKLQKQKK